ncbi:glycosyltransferase family protein [Taibaiella koreensis]|uniref:hypothetical protein n=1 Tax=Taibaiella koreensis TaxID=1268548 RepID=UPI000E59EE42|nr:hypothetical protein [Taibaiella koreensis]
MKKLSFADAPRILSAFEKDHYDLLKEMNAEGWNLWQVCKIPLFYKLIAATSGSGERNKGNSSHIAGLLKTLPRTLRYAAKKNRILFLANTADKLSKNEEGIYYNSIIDPILDLKVLPDPVLIEQPSPQGFLMPARYPWHINRQVLYYYAALKQKCHPRKITVNTEMTTRLSGLVNDFFLRNGYIDEIKPGFIADVLALFLREKQFFFSFFKKRLPPFVLGSECMGSGIMAAALELNIPFIELQHGSIDQHYPPYIWDRRFLEASRIMKPTQLWVFGTLAKEIILATGFFKEKEIIPVGYKKIDDMRAKAEDALDKKELSNQLLVVIQPMMHEFNKALITHLLSLKTAGAKILFKAHPLQPVAELSEYEAMMQGRGIRIVDKSENIHQLIRSSDLVVGYVTTCLEEALTLGKPSITITTPELPAGLHSMTGIDHLKDVIKMVPMEQMGPEIARFYDDPVYRQAWQEQVQYKKNDIYNVGYGKNIATAIALLHQKG